MHGCAAPGDESFLRGLGEVAGSDVALAAFTRFFWWYEWTDGCVCMYVCMYVGTRRPAAEGENAMGFSVYPLCCSRRDKTSYANEPRLDDTFPQQSGQFTASRL